jgi:hypothetical protein
MSEQPQTNKTQEEIIAEIQAHVKEQLEDTQEMIDLLDHTAEILTAQGKAKKYDEIIAFLTSEALEIPSAYTSTKEGHLSTASELLETLSDKVEAAFQNITVRQLVRFVSDYRPGDIRPDDQIKDPKERLQREAARFIVGFMTDSQKELIYYKIREEEITDYDQKEMLTLFDQVVGYPLEFARQTFLKDLDEDLEPVLEVLVRYTHNYTDALNETLLWLKDMRDRGMKFNSKTLLKTGETAVRRFNLEIEDKALLRQTIKEIALAYAEYVGFYGEIKFPDEEQAAAI